MKKSSPDSIKSALAQELLSTLSGIGTAKQPEEDLETEDIFCMLERPKKRDMGDLSLPCFRLAQFFGSNPAQLSGQIAENIALPEGISSVRATGPFLNFHWDRGGFVRSVLARSEEKVPARKEKRFAVVEYSSPNIAKPFHVGHLRATLIGNCLDRVYRHLGWEVASVNHLGDWGTQFGFVWAGCELWGKPEDDSVLGLLEIYRKATALKSARTRRLRMKRPRTKMNAVSSHPLMRWPASILSILRRAKATP